MCRWATICTVKARHILSPATSATLPVTIYAATYQQPSEGLNFLISDSGDSHYRFEEDLVVNTRLTYTIFQDVFLIQDTHD